MADESKNAGSKRGGIGPILFYVMLGIIVALLLLFLILRPRGTDAGAPSQQKSLIESSSPQSSFVG